MIGLSLPRRIFAKKSLLRVKVVSFSSFFADLCLANKGRGSCVCKNHVKALANVFSLITAALNSPLMHLALSSSTWKAFFIHFQQSLFVSMFLRLNLSVTEMSKCLSLTKPGYALSCLLDFTPNVTSTSQCHAFLRESSECSFLLPVLSVFHRFQRE